MVVRPSQVVLLVRDLKRLHPVVEREHQGLVLQSQGASKTDFKMFLLQVSRSKLGEKLE